MSYTRRHFTQLALAGIPSAAFLRGIPLLGAPAFQGKPNSVINGVIVGTITYSFRSMPDQSAEATLRYAVESGISQLELMGNVVNSYLQPPGSGARGRGAAPPAAAPAPGAAAPAPAPAGRGGGRGAVDPATLTATWNGVPCAPGQPGRDPGVPAPAGRGGAAAPEAAGGRGAGAAEQTPEQRAAAEQLAAERKSWREASSTMDKVKALRKMYNDAGVEMYAVKNLSMNASDEELEFQFLVAKALGADHITAELPNGVDAAAQAQLKRVGDYALRHNMFAAYHTHAQGSMTAFDTAFAASRGNKANVDFGHFVAGGNRGGTPLDFLAKYHDRIASYHLKDRTSPANCSQNLAWGTGETPIREILQTVRKNRWRIPASIELEYSIPAGSDAVKEVRKCLEYCRAALA